MRYTLQLTKVIVANIEATSDEEAIELAQDYDSNGWDGLWLHATPEIQILDKE